MGRVKEKVIEILDLWIDGNNVVEIADKTGMTVQDVSYTITNYITVDAIIERHIRELQRKGS